jgi:ElaB/YqjD/DUF883 family membrane-anchored ribosome-binding protein
MENRMTNLEAQVAELRHALERLIATTQTVSSKGAQDARKLAHKALMNRKRNPDILTFEMAVEAYGSSIVREATR